MSSIMFLNSDDFKVQDGTLTCALNKGLALILFYSTECPHCRPILPMFRAMPTVLHGCQYAIVNISNNQRLVQKAQPTTTPIKYVPDVLLYYNGRPVFKYSSKYSVEELKNFVITMSQKLDKKKPMSNGAQAESGGAAPPKEKEIPAYTVGIPMCSDDVCYISYDTAYKEA